MKFRSVIIYSIVFIWSSCQRGVSKGDIDLLVAEQVNLTEKILTDMNEFMNRHGEVGFENQKRTVNKFNQIHQVVLHHLDTLDLMNENRLSSFSKNFVDRTFGNFSEEYNVPISITDGADKSLIKLQIATLENIYFRTWMDDISFRFDQMEVVIIPNTIGFDDGDKIEGRIGLVAYSREMEPQMKVNGRNIEIKDGWGIFSVESKNIRSISAEVIFTDTVYTGVLNLTKK